MPSLPFEQRRKQYRGQGIAFHDTLQLLAALMLGAATPVLALPFQQIVRLQYHRRIGQQLLAQRLAANALLQ
ncbi:hypothetical protein D3C81_1637580 [compost metagenome]